MRLLAVMAAVGVVAGTTVVSDANDVAGKLDLRGAKAVTGPGILTLTITTWDAWPSKALSVRGKNRFTVLYDVNNDRVADFTGRIVYSGGKLALRITGRSSSFEPVPVTRVTKKRITFTHPIDIMLTKPTQRTLKIAVLTKYGTARDRMPDAPAWMTLVFPAPRQ